MNMRNRLRKLELQQPTSWDDRPPVVMGIAGRDDADVIGVHTGNKAKMVARAQGEDLDDLVSRARVALATPWCGLPLILMCAYADADGEQ